MLTNSRLAARFGRDLHQLRSDSPLSEDQMRVVAPSIFAAGKHASRSERYTYIPTVDVLRGLRKEGFEPFMVAQSRCRLEGKSAYTKHMIRMRHAAQVNARTEANEIILINSHDGASSYQMLAGVFSFVCANGLVCGTVSNDIRIPHKGRVQQEVIEGAFRVLDDFEAVDASVDAMKALTLQPGSSAPMRARHSPCATGSRWMNSRRRRSRSPSCKRPVVLKTRATRSGTPFSESRKTCFVAASRGGASRAAGSAPAASAASIEASA